MKTKIFTLLAMIFFVSSINAQNNEIKVPADVQTFVEKGAKVLALESADLNGDNMKDYILVFERQNPTEKDEYDYPKNQRPLLILTRDKNNKLSEAKRNEHIVMCSECGGMMGDPFMGVEVGTKTFTVNHYGGSAWRWGLSYKFNYSRIDKTWQLVRFEREDFHAIDQAKTMKREIKLPKDFGKVDISDFEPAMFDEKTSSTNEESTKTEVANSFQKIDFNVFNQQIEKAASGGETWVKMPTQVVVRMIEPFSEIRSRTIEMSAPTAESPDSLTVAVIDDGFMDDSVRGEKHLFELKMNEQGIWKFVSAEKAWRCQEGRGHQDFSTAPCL